MADHQTDQWRGSPPVPPDRGDFYELLSLLPSEQRTLLADLRRNLESDVAPIIADHWERGEFPTAIVPALAKMNLAGSKFTGYGCGGTASCSTGCSWSSWPASTRHWRSSSAAMTRSGWASRCAAPRSRRGGGSRRWPGWSRSARSRSPSQTSGPTPPAASPPRPAWVLNGRKKWIGNATWSDLTVVWARDEADGQVKGFVVERGTPGFSPPPTTASLTMCVRLAELAQAGEMREEQVSLAKMYTTTATRETVGLAREVLGGNGVLLDHHVTRYTTTPRPSTASRAPARSTR